MKFEPQRFSMDAATTLPSPPTPTAKGKQVTLPSFLKTAKPSTTSPLLRQDRGLANADVTTLRTGADSRLVIRDMTRVSPDLSAAVASYIRTAITDNFTAIAYNLDGSINPDGTSVAAQLLTRMNVLNDYTLGYDDSFTIRSLCEVWARELVTYGECAGELVLDKTRLPNKIQPISSTQIRLFPSNDGRKRIPKQFLGGLYIDLDIPTFFMTRLDEDLLEPYAISPIETAVQAVLFSAQFMDDIRRVVRRAIHPRQVFTIDQEKFLAGLPPEVKQDQEALTKTINEMIANVSEQVNGLEPEEALVFLSTIGVEVIDHGNTNLSNEYEAIQGMADAKLAAGTKTMPIVLGKSDGTSNTASTEAVMFVKYVEGTVWAKLNEMLSKIMTLAVRLMGQDVVVKFKFDNIDLRPSNELEAFRALKQSRVLALLSLGLMTDEEAAVELTGHLPPTGYKPLAGTGFMPNTGADPVQGDNASNSGSATNQALGKNKATGVKSGNGGKKKSAEIVQLQGL